VTGSDTQARGNRSNQTPAVSLPLDVPRPPVGSFLRGEEVLRLSEPETLALGKLAAETVAPEDAVVLSAWLVLLQRYTRQETLLIGYARETADGAVCRPRAVDLADDPAVIDLIGRTARDVADRAAEFRILYVPSTVSGDRASTEAIAEAMAASDVVLCFGRDGEDAHLRCEYDSEIYRGESVRGWLEQLVHLVVSMAGDPTSPASSHALIPSDRQLALVERAKACCEEYPSDQTLHQWFESQVETWGDRPAIVLPGRPGDRPEDLVLSYRELNEQANRLAHYLRELGVKPKDLVGLYTERNLDMVVGLLAILKAGAAYLPIDMSYPPERVAFMLGDAGVPVLLTHQSLISLLPDITGQVVPLDGIREALGRFPSENPQPLSGPDDLAYVIYTSGSTGTPKGAMISHRNVVRLFHATEPWFNFGPDDVWTLFHSIAFDFSVWELWGAILYGGRVILVPPWLSRSPDLFYDLLADGKVTMLNQTPSAFRQLIRIDEDRKGAASLSLRCVIFGGEALELQSLAPWFKRHGSVTPQLVNMYGITETTVHVTYRPLMARDLQESAGSAIGVPIPDLWILLLDERLRPVPDGVPGEIFVGGGGVCCGYLGREELTNSRFIADPFGGGSRLYRTGDLARRTAEGDLHYVGRVDHQVKLRGFRVELGEIETLLARHPAVNECLVQVREGEDGGKMLVAYVVAKADAPSVSLLRDYLARGLPDYMVPGAFVRLEAMPLTPHGKIDRAALPPPDTSRPELKSAFVPPRNELERAIASIYREILKLDEVGVHDNFFDLGGDSLRVGRVIGSLRETLGVSLEMVKLFEYPTISALAEHLGTSTSGRDPLGDAAERAARKREGLARRKQVVKERAL